MKEKRGKGMEKGRVGITLLVLNTNIIIRLFIYYVYAIKMHTLYLVI